MSSIPTDISVRKRGYELGLVLWLWKCVRINFSVMVMVKIRVISFGLGETLVLGLG